jgi:integrase/recombinase XerD
MFISIKGLTLNAATIRNSFQRIREKAGITRLDKSSCQPRLHDLRHTFAVHRLINWYRKKKDVQKLLPVLSTYMGHTYLAATSVYLTMTADLLREAGSRFQQYVQGELL